MSKIMRDDDAIRRERFKAGVRFWTVVGLIFFLGASYHFHTHNWRMGWFELGYGVSGLLCFAIVLWHDRRFRVGLDDH